ncbi:MAG: hypothetical protein LBR48_03075 [Dysgonamonadaceae bacterium]|nr:hypothetical protein [Dysgonamonadaceae bacterium]
MEPSGRKAFVVGYLPSWKSGFTPQWDKITHLNLAFGTITQEGTLNASILDGFRNTIGQAHGHGVKVLLSVGGGGEAKYFTTALLDPDLRKKLRDDLQKCVSDYDLDGIDLDYEEWTGGQGGIGAEDIPKRAALEELYKDLRTALGADKLITAAVSGSYDDGGWGFYNCYTNSMHQYLDFISIMIYDETGPWSGNTTGAHSSWSFFEKAIDHWLNNRKLPLEKLVAGVPFYGYTFLKEGDATGATSIAFKDIIVLSSDLEAYKKDQVGLTYYDGTVTMARKATYIREHGLGGIMIWELTQDTDDQEKSLLNVIHSELWR